RWVDGLAPRSERRVGTEEVDKIFGGPHLLRVRVSADAPSAKFRVAAGDFDQQSVLLPSAVADPSSLRWSRLRVVPVGGGSRTIDLLVSEARAENGRTRVFLVLPDMLEVAVRDLLPPGVGEVDCGVGSAKRLKHVEAIAALGEFETFLRGRTRSGVGAVLGPYAHLATVNVVAGAPADRAGELLRKAAGVDRSLQLYAQGRGERRLREILN